MSQAKPGFWTEAIAIQGSITPVVMPYVVGIGIMSIGVSAVAWITEWWFDVRIGLPVAPYEIAGAALSLLLILRTNAGYERWWEGRILWGGIVNQSRNLGVGALAYGPANARWREDFIKWTAAFPHVARCSLRGEYPSQEVYDLLGHDRAERIASSAHMPSYVALRLGELLREASGELGMGPFAFLQLDRERASLIDHIGGCERILKTPLPVVYSIKVRRFLAIFLLVLPFALLHQVIGVWLIPLITMLVAYPLFSLDQIGIELQNPFSKSNLSHLPLDDISATIENNLLGMLRDQQEAVAVSVRPVE